MSSVQLNASAPTTGDDAARAALQEAGEIPRHIAIIMDGNGRWARQKGQNRVFGHREGVESVRDVTEAAAQIGVEVLTLYTFSTENWHRPPKEVTALMELLVRTLRREATRLNGNNIRLSAIGEVERLPARCRRELEESLEMTAGNTRMTLNLALSYSGRWDIMQAVQSIVRDVSTGVVNQDDLTEDTLNERLVTAGLPDPDLVIRTGGEQRISNFLLWQAAYAELFFANTLWPEFRREQLYEAVRAYQRRERRFGRVEAIPSTAPP
ncbi:isoprenyl transferase [soil metagenome]